MLLELVIFKSLFLPPLPIICSVSPSRFLTMCSFWPPWPCLWNALHFSWRHKTQFQLYVSLTHSQATSQPITKLINPRLRGTIVFFWFLVGSVSFPRRCTRGDIFSVGTHLTFVFRHHTVQLIPVTRKLKTSFTWITNSRSGSRTTPWKQICASRAAPRKKKTGTEITHTLTHDLQRLFAISFWSNDEKCLLNVKPNQIGDPKIYFTLHTARP